MSRFIVAYWVESPSPYLVIDTEPDTDGVASVIGSFTCDPANKVAEALNEKHERDSAPDPDS